MKFSEQDRLAVALADEVARGDMRRIMGLRYAALAEHGRLLRETWPDLFPPTTTDQTTAESTR
jgi:hypothetical protein